MPGYLSSRRQFEQRYEVPFWKDPGSDVLSGRTGKSHRLSCAG
jgi:hypothetical protein